MKGKYLQLQGENNHLFANKPINNLTATNNRFAALDIEDKGEVVDDDLHLTGPVTYSLETSQWSLSGAISHLRRFKLQNITADKRSTLFLRFAHEAQAKKVIHWLTHEMKINAKIKRVQNSLGDQKCYYCHQLGHWGSECQESLLSIFPSELITLISEDLIAPELFHFMLSSKFIFNAIAARQRKVIVARPHWHAHYPMKLKLGLLKYFKSVEKVVFRSLKCSTTTIPMELIATKYTKLTSLTINNCRFSLDDNTEIQFVPKSWINGIEQMTQLKKLDLDRQEITSDDYKHLVERVTYLTQLRVSSKFEYGTFGLPSGLKKLSIKAARSRESHMIQINGGELDQIKSLFIDGVMLLNTPAVLPALERLIVLPSYNVQFSTPNLTKLMWRRTHRAPEDLKHLRTLTLDSFRDSLDLSPLTALRKLTLSDLKRYAEIDLSPLNNLKELTLADSYTSSIKNIPSSVDLLRVSLISYKWNDSFGSALANLKITRFECLVSANINYEAARIIQDYLEELIRCTTLQELKIEHDNKNLLPFYRKMTQLKVLDLVKSSVGNSERPSLHEDIIELSKELPNTKIYVGLALPMSIQRPKIEYWKCDKVMSTTFLPVCRCERCRQAVKREDSGLKGQYDEEFDSNRSVICVDQKPFKEHWSWY